METRVSYILVGAFVVILGGALVAGVLWFGVAAPSRAYQSYAVYVYDSVAGLSQDAVVDFRGVNVGRVAQVSIDPQNPQRVRLLLEVNEDTPVKQDTVALIQTQGLTGIGYVNLVGSTRDSPPLKAKAGQPYPVIPGKVSGLQSLTGTVEDLLTQLSTTANRVNAILDQQNVERIGNTLAHLQAVTAALARNADSMAGTMDAMSATMQSAKGAADRLPGLVSQAQQSAAALGEMAQQLSTTGSVIASSVSKGAGELSQLQSELKPQLTSMLNDLSRTAANMRRVSETLQRNPSVLLYGGAPPRPGPGERTPGPGAR